MEDRELLKKLNNLKSLKPDSKWKQDYREILHSQIFAGRTASLPKSNLGVIWENLSPRKILIDLAKPVWTTGLLCVLILAGGIGGVYASKNTKPGDSLYIAKIVSEKAQLAMAFNEEDKAKLGLEFATNRAKEITQVLRESKESENKQNEKVEKLSQNFKKEISGVKNRLTTIKVAKEQIKEDESDVFGANLGKTDQRMEIAEPIKPAVVSEILPKDQPAAAATTTVENLNSQDKVLEEVEKAEKLFDEKNYNGTIDKIEEAKQIMSQADQGQVKGESETASSTDNN